VLAVHESCFAENAFSLAMLKTPQMQKRAM